MVSFPFKVFLFVAGGSAAALGTAFFTGAFDPMNPVAVANLPAAETAPSGGVSEQRSDSVAPSAPSQSAPGASSATPMGLFEPPAPAAASASGGAPSLAADASGRNVSAAVGASDSVLADEKAVGIASKEHPLTENGVGSAAPAAETPPAIATAPVQGTAASVPSAMPTTPGVAGPDPKPNFIALAAPGRGTGASPSPEAAAADPARSLEAASGPSFDILRVEGNGSVVLAGKAAGGSQVEIVDGDRILGSTRAGPDGDFAFVLDDPLVPGSHQLTLRQTNPDGKATVSSQSAILSIPENESGEVLAMLEQPGQASQFLRLPQVASSAAAPVAGPDASSASPDAVTQPAALGATAKGEPSRTTPETPKQAAAETLAAGETGPLGETVGPTASASNGPQSTVDQGADQQVEVAAVMPGGKNAAPGAQPVAVDAVEIEGRKIFVAGAALPGQTVRVYAGEDYLGEAVGSPEGRFLVEGERDLAVGEHLVRADALDANGGKVVARAAVPFQREPGENVAAMAEPAVALAQAQAGVADAAASQAPASLGDRPSSPVDASAPAGDSSVAAQAPAAPHAAETAVLPDAAAGDPSANPLGGAQPQGQAAAGQADAASSASATADSTLTVSGTATIGPDAGSAPAPAAVGTKAVTEGSSGSATVANDVHAAPAAEGRAALAQAGADGSQTSDEEAGRITSPELEASAARTAPEEDGAAAKEPDGSSPALLSADAASVPATNGDAPATKLADAAAGSNATAEAQIGDSAASNTDAEGAETGAALAASTEMAGKQAPGSATSEGSTAATASSAETVSPTGSMDAGAIGSAGSTGSSPASPRSGAEQNPDASGAAAANATAELLSESEPAQGAATASSAAVPAPSIDVASASSPLTGNTDAKTPPGQALPGAGDSTASDAQGAASGVDLPAAGEARSTAGSSVAAASAVPEVLAPKLRSVDGAVIIRRGDSLWRISKRVYGRGTRYSTIYLANNDQIRDPDRIWPGQIFSVPPKTSQGEAADLSKVADQAMTRVR